ncbi:hypothetical protein WS70_06085 [Burkholderia mayonis]|uniref:Uncharacterized protein n=1 Tax=Burkholderia mayonis TaxID=1385591 RepID=A0A1B4FCT6_9BURK|nr:hypothetical protein WS70_06085 [Burkholderia mayonis]KVE34985.1 hypothetical protein WS69_15515 [Burkholderia sp. BDU5]KVE48883.1 hypothetical protein WS70_01090 [Burkholderia mayonis]
MREGCILGAARNGEDGGRGGAARSRRPAAIAGRSPVHGRVDSRPGDMAGSRRLRAMKPRLPTGTPAEATIRKVTTSRNRDAIT